VDEKEVEEREQKRRRAGARKAVAPAPPEFEAGYDHLIEVLERVA
jgi:hypothetical protein